jgi:hypothetical protein
VTRRGILWAAAALAGIVATAALAWSASQLANQQIALSSQPLSVTSGLAPARPVPRDRDKATKRATRPTASRPRHRVASPSPTPPTPAAPALTPAVTPPAATTSPARATTSAPASSRPRGDGGSGSDDGSGQGAGASAGGRRRDD